MAGIANMRRKLMPLQTGGGVRAPDVGAEVPNIANNDPYASYKVRDVLETTSGRCAWAPVPCRLPVQTYSLSGVF